MNVVFLDYDGVVNNLIWLYNDNQLPKCSWNKWVDTPSNKEEDIFCDFDKRVEIEQPDGNKEKIMICNDWQAIQWLSQFCIKFDCKIVVTSTWRLFKDYKKALILGGLRENVEIFGCTDEIHTEDYHHDRGREIRRYLDEHPDIEHYLILDDEDCFFDFQQPYFVHCKHNGFGYPEFNAAVNIAKEKWGLDKTNPLRT